MDELVKSIRICVTDGNCEECMCYCNGDECPGIFYLAGQAADAIEGLLTLKAIADAKIERLESAKPKKKRPPKRLPCTCGRKRLELWWSNEGWFLKCPNCGRKSQSERYQSHVNSAWNKELLEPPKEEEA